MITTKSSPTEPQSPVRVRAATLAIGTEVTDGQITDRNSAWISQKLVHSGVQVIEHRAVADDHADIERALRELSMRVELLFITGGLGPTSDDFTRDVLAHHFSMPLEYDEESWRQIEEKLSARGVAVREIQKQQCFYPRGSRVLFNPAGTANAFSFQAAPGGHKVKVYALPGPPTEIAAVWEAHIASEIEDLTPENEREHLVIYRCLGRAESEVAEKTETAIRGSHLRVGYRAHLPYVEVKLWYFERDRDRASSVLQKVEAALGDWIVNRNNEDVADPLLDLALNGKSVHIHDFASRGFLQERLNLRLKDRKLDNREVDLVISSYLKSSSAVQSLIAETAGETLILTADEARGEWKLIWKAGEKSESTLELKAPFNYKLGSERGRRYVVEKALYELSRLI